ncbi:MAG: acetylornithine transaminase [Mycobacteriales bacterium]
MTGDRPAPALLDRWAAVMLPTYATPALALVRGEGTRVWDADGHCYLDLLAGIAVNSLGHAHPAVVAAVSRQLATIGHTSNLYATEPAVALAERLLDLVGAPAGKVFFANSGTEAVEAAVKLARRHGYSLDPTGGRLELVAAHGGFHGRTLGALAVTGNPGKREPFLPLPGPVTFVPYGDAAALAAAVTERTAAVVLEPVQGEAGVVVPPQGYLAAARAACDRVGALLILDEVQGGIGRAGYWFAHQHPAFDPVRADVVTLAKGLGAGLPIGACLALSAPAIAALRPGEHGSTFGGNPVCAAAALAVLDTIAADGLLAAAREVGDHLATGIAAVGHPLVGQVAGVGLWRSVVLTAPVAPLVERAARDAGFLVNAAVPTRVRLAPPLIFTREEADEFVAALPAILDAAGQPAMVPA